MGILVCLGSDFLWKFFVKRILRKRLTLKPNLHNKSGNRET